MYVVWVLLVCVWPWLYVQPVFRLFMPALMFARLHICFGVKPTLFCFMCNQISCKNQFCMC